MLTILTSRYISCLQIVEFVSVLLTIGSEAAEKELVQLRAIKHILDLFFE